MQWQFKNVKVDKAYTTLSAGNTTILTIAMKDGKMQYTWDEEWRTWDVFQQHDDVRKYFTSRIYFDEFSERIK